MSNARRLVEGLVQEVASRMDMDEFLEALQEVIPQDDESGRWKSYVARFRAGEDGDRLLQELGWTGWPTN